MFQDPFFIVVTLVLLFAMLLSIPLAASWWAKRKRLAAAVKQGEYCSSKPVNQYIFGEFLFAEYNQYSKKDEKWTIYATACQSAGVEVQELFNTDSEFSARDLMGFVERQMQLRYPWSRVGKELGESSSQ